MNGQGFIYSEVEYVAKTAYEVGIELATKCPIGTTVVPNNCNDIIHRFLEILCDYVFDEFLMLIGIQ